MQDCRQSPSCGLDITIPASCTCDASQATSSTQRQHWVALLIVAYLACHRLYHRPSSVPGQSWSPAPINSKLGLDGRHLHNSHFRHPKPLWFACSRDPSSRACYHCGRPSSRHAWSGSSGQPVPRHTWSGGWCPVSNANIESPSGAISIFSGLCL